MANPPNEYLSLDNEFRLFCWALYRAGIFTIPQFREALKFIQRVKDENIPIKQGLSECEEIERG